MSVDRIYKCSCLFMTTDMYCILCINCNYCNKMTTTNFFVVLWWLGFRVCASSVALRKRRGGAWRSRRSMVNRCVRAVGILSCANTMTLRAHLHWPKKLGDTVGRQQLLFVTLLHTHRLNIVPWSWLSDGNISYPDCCKAVLNILITVRE